jgi:glutamine amidotransferase
MSSRGLVIVDYGAGNLVSIRNALELLGAAPTIASTPEGVAAASVIVVPGVGASGPAMDRMQRQGLDGPIRDAVDGGAWYVGICLGLQLLFERSDEDDARMLGLLAGDVVAIPDAPRLPHIGWNQLEVRRPHALLDGVADGAPAYFVHSYVAHHRLGPDHRLPAAPGALRQRWPATAAQHARPDRRRAGVPVQR